MATTKNNTNALDGYAINADIDIPDIRDWIYRPALIRLKTELPPPANLQILDQKKEGACTGFGLAAVINHLNREQGNAEPVSARMLYEMARLYDEWEGENYSGSSCRGAIKGWFNMGVCSDELWPYKNNAPGNLTVQRAKNARKTTIGAYYRLDHRISDFHAAINETGVLYVSANVHEGWSSSRIKANGKIPYSKKTIGGHAFALVGYNREGFWVQNSWSESWGKKGLALWTYEDWQENIRDAWVLRLALPTPQIWHKGRSAGPGAAVDSSRKVNRAEIAGHFVHIDDGDFHGKGKYWSNEDDVRQTAGHLAESDKYDHLLFYAHGGLNSPEASATRIAAMRDVFKANRIYPFHFMYDTGLMEELKDIILNKEDSSIERVGSITDATDWLVEKLSRGIGRALWREMKQGATSPFKASGAGAKVIGHFVKALQGRPADKPLKVHVSGHSTGGILMANFVTRLAAVSKLPIESATLFAPAATSRLVNDKYLPLLAAGPQQCHIGRMTVFNLSEQRELDDTVGGVYRKSLLYLVSKAFEEERGEPIAGMQLYTDKLQKHNRLQVVVSGVGKASDKYRSNAETHGEFDNDVQTMNSLLQIILGQKPRVPFNADNLSY